MYPSRLSLHLRQFFLIFNFFDVCIQLARTSRCQPCSSFVAPLKKARHPAGKQRKESQPPPGIKAKGDECGQNDPAEDEHDQAAHQPLASFYWTNIGDTHFIHFSIQF
jgi:hypothetical protein